MQIFYHYPFFLFLRIPEFGALWKDILHRPQSLCPQFSGLCPFCCFYFCCFYCSVFKCSSHMFNILLTLGLEGEWIHFSWNEVEKKNCAKDASSSKTCYLCLNRKKAPTGLIYIANVEFSCTWDPAFYWGNMVHCIWMDQPQTTFQR